MNNLAVEQQVSITLDKQDLINIKIDEVLTNLENQLSLEEQKAEIKKLSLEHERKLLEESNSKIIIKKYLPKECKDIKIDRVIYYINPQAIVDFQFTEGRIVINKCDTSFIKNSNNKIETLEKELQTCYDNIRSLKEQILKIEKNTKRIHAQVVKGFLDNSPKGKELLKMLDLNKEIKLLS